MIKIVIAILVTSVISVLVGIYITIQNRILARSVEEAIEETIREYEAILRRNQNSSNKDTKPIKHFSNKEISDLIVNSMIDNMDNLSKAETAPSDIHQQEINQQMINIEEESNSENNNE